MKKTRHHPRPHNAERGNVLFYILIAIVLLAALSFAVSDSMRGNVTQISQERARLAAAEIVEFSNIMTNAVAQLRLRGVSDTQLCFDDPAWGANNYAHAGCTDDYNRIFHVSGGGMNWTRPPADAMDSAAAPDNLWHIYSNNEIEHIGTTCGNASCSDLILVVDELNLETCKEINGMLGVTEAGDNPPQSPNLGVDRFTGSFGYNATIGNQPASAALRGQSAGCFYKTSVPEKHVFYKVLLAR